MKEFNEIFHHRSIFVTGHTGFKGAWLTLWLWKLGACVTGYALPPENPEGIYQRADISNKCNSVIDDIRNGNALLASMEKAQPEVVFHLAAQPLVREGYRSPEETFDINVMGTIHVLEAVRKVSSVKTVVVITSDKCYENKNTGKAYNERDRLGGLDPYSCSKAACELVVDSYRNSFLQSSGLGVATVRAGNVIGGGDWASERIVPDCYRSLKSNKPIIIRNPRAIRPWQHVLEPLSGYLWLAARLMDEPKQFSGAWNFGPREEAQIPVAKLVDLVIDAWQGGSWEQEAKNKDSFVEAQVLHLDISKAEKELTWRPALTIEHTIALTNAWYKNPNVDDIFSLQQIHEYIKEASLQRLPWANTEQLAATV